MRYSVLRQPVGRVKQVSDGLILLTCCLGLRRRQACAECLVVVLQQLARGCHISFGWRSSALVVSIDSLLRSLLAELSSLRVELAAAKKAAAEPAAALESHRAKQERQLLLIITSCCSMSAGSGSRR